MHLKIFGTLSTYASQRSAALLLLLVLATPVAAFCAEVVDKCTYPLFKATDVAGLTPQATVLWAAVSFFAVMGAYHGAIAHRCGSILYHRWFR